MADAAGLTVAQAHCQRIIQELTALDGYSPSFAEIQREMCLASKARVSDLVLALKERGHIAFRPREARSIVVVKPITLLPDVEFVLAPALAAACVRGDG